MKNEFNWGNSSDTFKSYLINEIFEGKFYEKIYPVQEGDVVLDLGASIGPFVWSIMDKASKVIAVEPSLSNCELIKLNSQGFDVEVIPKGLARYTNSILKGNHIYDEIYNEHGWERKGDVEDSTEVITFQQILEQFNLNKIDFIKTDCEGGEYALFTDENMPFLLNNVRSIVGEWHLSRRFPEQKVDFRHFRDKYLKQFPNYEVYSVDGVNIKWDLWNEHFIEYYDQVIIHINNET